jgi:transketolase
LTRQGVPVFGETQQLAEAGVARGGYVLVEPQGVPDVVLIATGSEVQLTVAAASTLAERGINARVVSMPCQEWFDLQPGDYQESVLPRAVRARVAVEAASPLSWWRYVGDTGQVVGIDHYGASADAETLFREFGFTADAVVDAAVKTISDTRSTQ